MKIVTIVGTRPEIIRLSAVLKRIDEAPQFEHVLVHTGQNWDPRLKDIFFEDLGLRRPDRELEIDTSSLGASIGSILRETESILVEEQPDAFLVLGDTNSSLSLIMAKRMRIPTYHMEAGNRCFDANVPEEMNRRLIDHTADFNLVYTEHARRNLLAEGIEPRRILVTGSPLREVFDVNLDEIRASQIVESLGLTPRDYFLVSAHREENVDNEHRLRQILQSLNAVAERWGKPVVVSVHPRTRNRLQAMNESDGIELHPLIRTHEPLGFIDYNKLQIEAACVLSDSGTIAEESAILGFSAVTLRSSIERPEILDAGMLTMVDVDPARVVAGIEWAMRSKEDSQVPSEYCVRDTSSRVLNFILSTAPEHKQWSGLR